MILKHEGVLALVEASNDDDGWSKRLGTSHLDESFLYTEISEKLSILIRVASSFMKNPIKPAPFHASILYTDAKTFSGELKAVLVDPLTDCRGKFVAFRITLLFHTAAKSIPLLQMFFPQASAHLIAKEQKESLTGAAWSSTAWVHPKSAGIYFGFWSCSTRDARDFKYCWLDSINYLKAWEKVCEKWG